MAEEKKVVMRKAIRMNLARYHISLMNPPLRGWEIMCMGLSREPSGAVERGRGEGREGRERGEGERGGREGREGREGSEEREGGKRGEREREERGRERREQNK